MTDDLWPDPVNEVVPEATTAPRGQLAAEAVWWDAVAADAATRGAQARQQLDAQARQEFTRDGIAPTWRIPGVGTVPLGLTGDRVNILDEAAYTAWVAERHPDNIEKITRVRPAFDKVLRDAAAKLGAPCTTAGDVIPGLVFVAGGQPKGISIRASSDAKAEAAGLASSVLDSLFQSRTGTALLTGEAQS